MNRFSILPRLATPVLAAALRRFPVVVLTGARQTGKTTLATTPPISRGRLYRALDDFDTLDRARTAPHAFLDEAPRLTLDEVQRIPEILSAIRRAVDVRRTPGRFLLTGSANLLLMRQVSESLAGRAVYQCLWPMTSAEKAGRPASGIWDRLMAVRSLGEAGKALAGGRVLQDLPARILAGGYPGAAVAASSGERAAWFDGYLKTYLERDLLQAAALHDLSDFRRLMKLVALRIGQLLNQSLLARDANLPQPTAHRYLNLLEVSFQTARLSPYAVSRTKRLVKTPRLYWTDAGLAAFLAGMGDARSVRSSPLFGALVENLLLMAMLAWRETVIPRPEIHFWRTQTGAEVDFIIEKGTRLLPIEVKAGERVRTDDAKGIEAFLSEYPEAVFGLVLYPGAEVLALSERTLAAPLSCFLA